MNKMIAAVSWMDMAHQKALSTRTHWLGEKAHAIEETRVYPWSIFQQPRNIPSKEVAILSKRRLLDDLAELAEGTTIMGKPERTPPRFGPIASPRSSSTKSGGSQKRSILYETPSPTPARVHTQTEIVAPIPIAPIPLLRRAFEVRTSTTTLSAPLTAFCGSFNESRSESPDDSVSDENEPPARLFEYDQNVAESTDFEIPKPKLRVRREPFAVLHLDLGSAPCSERDPTMDADDLEESEKCQLLGVFCENAQGASGYRLKGWERLRSKAPRALDISVIDDALKREREASKKNGFRDLSYAVNTLNNTERSEVPHAPKMINVPLPPDTPSVPAFLKAVTPEDRGALLPQKNISLPSTPCRQALLAILNEGPNV